MIYAKIKEDGTIEQFPYIINNNNDIPPGVVEVDILTNKPALRWDQKTTISGVEKIENQYLATYGEVVEKFATPDDKLKAITTNKKMQEDSNERLFAYKAKELLSQYSDMEKISWDQQRTEAAAYSTDNTVPTPILSVIATARGISVSDLANKVLNKSAEYELAYGTLLGKYQKNKDLLSSINLEDDTTWNTIDMIERI